MSGPRLIVLAAILAAFGMGLWYGGQGLIDLAKAWLAPILIQESWQQGRSTGKAPPPWPWADTSPVLKLSVPRLDQEHFVLAGASGRALAFGPVLSEHQGARVLFGHRDTHFAFLKDVRSGDAVVTQALNGPAARYRITETAVRHKDGIALARRSGGGRCAGAGDLLSLRCGGCRRTLALHRGGSTCQLRTRRDILTVGKPIARAI